MSQDLGRVSSGFGRARGYSIQFIVHMETTKGKRARMAMIPESSVLGESTHDRISDGLMLRKPELEQRDSREYRKFLRHLCSWQSSESGSHWLRGMWHGGSVYL